MPTTDQVQATRKITRRLATPPASLDEVLYGKKLTIVLQRQPSKQGRSHTTEHRSGVAMSDSRVPRIPSKQFVCRSHRTSTMMLCVVDQSVEGDGKEAAWVG